MFRGLMFITCECRANILCLKLFSGQLIRTQGEILTEFGLLQNYIKFDSLETCHLAASII